MTKKSILIADDQELNREFLKDIFAESYQILEASNGEEAISILKERGNDVKALLLDIRMPKIDGFGVMLQMERLGLKDRFPIILITMLEDIDVALRGYDLGCYDIIYKPFNPKVAKRRIENALELYEAREKQNSKIDKMKNDYEAEKAFNMCLGSQFLAVFSINPQTGTYKELRRNDGNPNHLPPVGRWDGLMDYYADNYVTPSDLDDFRKSVTINGIMSKMHDGNTFTFHDFRRYIDCMKRWTRANISYDGTTLYVSVSDIPEKMAMGPEEKYVEYYLQILRTIGENVYEYDPSDHSTDSVEISTNGIVRRHLQQWDSNNYASYIKELVHPEDLLRLENDMKVDINQPENDQFCSEYRVRYSVQSPYRWHRAAWYRLMKDDHPVYLVFSKDIQDEKSKTIGLLAASGHRITFPSDIDALTGLPKKQAFYDRVEQLLYKSENSTYEICVFDVYRLKMVNELFGQEKGDELLACISSVIREMTEEVNGIVGRLDGAHFAICIGQSNHELPGMILHVLEERAKSVIPDYHLIVNFGICIVENNSILPQILCDHALTALKSIKGDYNKRYAIYNNELRERILLEQQITNEMEEALKREEFVVFFQPIYSLSQECFVSAEALVRWNHPKNGMYSPGVFMPLFEQNGFVIKLDYYVWEKTCALLKEWKEKGYHTVPISVNVSALHILNEPDFCEKVYAIVQKYGVDINDLRLELTESAYAGDVEHVRRVTSRLKDMGFIILMDDFGSGYSSLNMLKDLPVDILKIDMRFLDQFMSDPRTRTLLTSIVRMARWLKIPVIAEGVETKEQSDFLYGIGCPRIQGYYYSRPLPVEEYEKILSGAKNIADDLIQYANEANFRDIDMDNLVMSDPKLELLWNENTEGMGIAELYGHNFEVIKANKAYFTLLQTDSESYYKGKSNLFDTIEEMDKSKLFIILEESNSDRQVKEIILRHCDVEGTSIDVKMRLRYIGECNGAREYCFAAQRQ